MWEELAGGMVRFLRNRVLALFPRLCNEPLLTNANSGFIIIYLTPAPSHFDWRFFVVLVGYCRGCSYDVNRTIYTV